MSQHLVEQRRRRVRNFLLPLKHRFKMQIRDGEKPFVNKDEYIAEYCIVTGVRPTVAKKYLKLYTDTYTLDAFNDGKIEPSGKLITELEKEIKEDDEANKRMEKLLKPKQQKSEKKN